MTFAAILDLLLRYGPQAVVLAEKLTAAVKAGKGAQEVTPAEWAELTRLATQSADDIYLRLGITPPPKGDS